MRRGGRQAEARDEGDEGEHQYVASSATNHEKAPVLVRVESIGFGSRRTDRTASTDRGRGRHWPGRRVQEVIERDVALSGAPTAGSRAPLLDDAVKPDPGPVVVVLELALGRVGDAIAVDCVRPGSLTAADFIRAARQRGTTARAGGALTARRPAGRSVGAVVTGSSGTGIRPSSAWPDACQRPGSWVSALRGW